MTGANSSHVSFPPAGLIVTSVVNVDGLDSYWSKIVSAPVPVKVETYALKQSIVVSVASVKSRFPVSASKYEKSSQSSEDSGGEPEIVVPEKVGVIPRRTFEYKTLG